MTNPMECMAMLDQAIELNNAGVHELRSLLAQRRSNSATVTAAATGSTAESNGGNDGNRRGEPTNDSTSLSETQMSISNGEQSITVTATAIGGRPQSSLAPAMALFKQSLQTVGAILRHPTLAHLESSDVREAKSSSNCAGTKEDPPSAHHPNRQQRQNCPRHVPLVHIRLQSLCTIDDGSSQLRIGSGSNNNNNMQQAFSNIPSNDLVTARAEPPPENDQLLGPSARLSQAVLLERCASRRSGEAGPVPERIDNELCSMVCSAVILNMATSFRLLGISIPSETSIWQQMDPKDGRGSNRSLSPTARTRQSTLHKAHVLYEKVLACVGVSDGRHRTEKAVLGIIANYGLGVTLQASQRFEPAVRCFHTLRNLVVSADPGVSEHFGREPGTMIQWATYLVFIGLLLCATCMPVDDAAAPAA